MKHNEFNKFCKSLPMTTYIVQWRESHVWKVGGKVFAIGRWGSGKSHGITFKVSDITYECMKNVNGFRPAPYFASRGMKWLQYYSTELKQPDGELKSFLTKSHHIVASGLTKKQRLELGLNI